jgi:hypothetical protein
MGERGMSNGEFGDYTLPDDNMKVSGGGLDHGPLGQVPIERANPDMQRMIQDDPDVADLFSSGRDSPYDRDANVRSRRITHSREVVITPRAKGGKVAKWGFIFGIAAAIMGLVFMGGFLLEYYVTETEGLFVSIGCWLGLLGAGFSLVGIILSIIGLALGAGLNKGKAVFGIIFSILYWAMIGMYFMLAVFILASMSSSAEIVVW